MAEVPSNTIEAARGSFFFTPTEVAQLATLQQRYEEARPKDRVIVADQMRRNYRAVYDKFLAGFELRCTCDNCGEKPRMRVSLEKDDIHASPRGQQALSWLNSLFLEQLKYIQFEEVEKKLWFLWDSYIEAENTYIEGAGNTKCRNSGNSYFSIACRLNGPPKSS